MHVESVHCSHLRIGCAHLEVAVKAARSLLLSPSRQYCSALLGLSRAGCALQCYHGHAAVQAVLWNATMAMPQAVIDRMAPATVYSSSENLKHFVLECLVYDDLRARCVAFPS
jgi:hypothetical protein